MPIRVLVVGDSPDAAVLLIEQIRLGGYDPISERVDTAAGMEVALDRNVWDLVVSDHKMPMFYAFGVLEVLKQRALDLPCIVVSGAIDQETAVALLRAGAHDFVPKEDYSRLLPAIARECRQAAVRLERRQVEEPGAPTNSIFGCCSSRRRWPINRWTRRGT